jgi:hypothetical protein
MRKKIIQPVSKDTAHSSESWLGLEPLAQVEVTSEEAANPVESALIPGPGPGWRAEQPGEQSIQLIFDQPLSLGRIHLRFDERERARTQQFVLRWLPSGEEHPREIVRQQYTFSPPDTIEEIEDYRVDLKNVAALELRIVPDISGGTARASLAQLSLA